MSKSKLELLTPQNSQVIFIDQQPQMAFGVQSIDRQTLLDSPTMRHCWRSSGSRCGSATGRANGSPTVAGSPRG